MSKKHLTIAISLLVLLSMLLAACGGAAEPTPAPAPAAEAPAAEAPAAEAQPDWGSARAVQSGTPAPWCDLRCSGRRSALPRRQSSPCA